MTNVSDYIGITLHHDRKSIEAKMYVYGTRYLNDEQWSNEEIMDIETKLVRKSIVEIIFGEFRKDLQNLNLLICLEKTQEAADLLDNIMDKMYDASLRKQNDN